MGGGTTAPTFRAATTTPATYFVKVTGERARVLACRYHALRSCFATTPHLFEPVLPVDGVPAVRLASGGLRFLVFPLVDGTQRSCCSSDDAVRTGRVLASLHRVLATKARPPLGAKMAAISSPEQTEAYLHRVQAVALTLLPLPGRALEARLLVGDFATLLRRYRTGLVGLRDRWPDLGQQLLHGDFHPENLLWRGDRDPVCVLDWDRLSYGPRVFDVAKFLYTTCFEASSAGTRFAIAASRSFLDGYDSICPLTTPERAAIPVLMLSMHLSGIWVVEQACAPDRAALDHLLPLYLARGQHLLDVGLSEIQAAPSLSRFSEAGFADQLPLIH